jgi:hypothetical protein
MRLVGLLVEEKVQTSSTDSPREAWSSGGEVTVMGDTGEATGGGM